MQKLRITAVEYLNTALMVEGLRKTVAQGGFRLSLDHPAECARKIKNGEADIGLVPVAAIPDLHPNFIFGDYCIGAAGPVRTVRLFARCPYQRIQSVILDPHSRTSVQLIQVLYQKFWKKEVNFIAGSNGFEKEIFPEDTGILVIGDKAFGVEQSYPYSYDLAEEWIRYTGKHFVFAAWISQQPMATSAIHLFNAALRYGLENRQSIIAGWFAEGRYQGIDVADYLANNISYEFDQPKRAGLELFYELSGWKDYVLKIL